MTDFVYAQPVKIYFGCGKFQKLEAILQELGYRKCILVCDKFFEPRAQKLVDSMDMVCAYFGDVEPNPQLSGAVETARLAQKYNADAIVGVGGGSTIDTAKFAAAIAKGNEDAIYYYRGKVAFPKERLAVVAVPTTAGTGSEVTQVSVMNNGKEKLTINNPVFMPVAAIVDPEMSLTVPPKTTMATGLDALAHALEGYWSKNHQPITDFIAIEAVRLILDNLKQAYTDGNNIEARSNMSYAAMLAGMAFALPKTAACHACSYPLSEDYHLSHGEACAFTLDSFVKVNADERLEYLCVRSGLSGTDELAQRISELKKLAGLCSTLSDFGEVNIEKLVKDCLAHPLMNNNPVKLTEAAMRSVFEKLQ